MNSTEKDDNRAGPRSSNKTDTLNSFNNNLDTLSNNNFPRINIATHNVRSFLQSHKQQALINHYNFDKLDIIGIQETNFKSHNDVLNFNNSTSSQYTSFFNFEDTQSSGTGVGLLINKRLADHIYKHNGKYGRIIFVDFQFRNKFRIRLINCYISSSNKTLRKQTYNDTIKLIAEAKGLNMEIILLGDFNAVPDRPSNMSHANLFFSQLDELQLFNVFDLIHDNANQFFPSFFHSAKYQPTRIDHIYCSSLIAAGINFTDVTAVDPHVSDHSIVFTNISIAEINISTKTKNQIKKKTYQYDQMDDKSWNKFSKQVDAYVNSCQLTNISPEKLQSKSALNFFWDLIQGCIIKAADKCIPIRNSSAHSRDLRPRLLKNMYKQLVAVQKLQRLTRQGLRSYAVPKNWTTIYQQIVPLIAHYKLPWPTIVSPTLNDLKNTQPLLSDLYRVHMIAIKLEEDKHKSKQIKAALKHRCDNFHDDQARMFDSILGRKRHTIVLDRCLDNSTNDLGLLTTADEVKWETNRHFQQTTGTHHHFVELTDDWKSWYEPLSSINESIYDHLMDPPKEDEWYQLLKTLPNDKAPGPSKVSNEMLKHLGTKMNKIFWMLACACLTLSCTPDRWNLAFVYPIPKPKPWEYNLNNTRPITLLECPRKALVKLINKRLLDTLSKENVLKGHNFAGLPFRSTFEPIHIMDNIKYDHLSNKEKDLWILFQDMSKAYDRVNLAMLLRALNRLKLPNTFLNFVASLFSNRLNQIFTAHGNTDLYPVFSGIDQGEIISPILWCIYYDPLLCRIQNTSLGYNLTAEWRPNINFPTKSSVSTNISTLAYMDDTLWISKSKEDLEAILSIADDFYQLNSILVNWDKSVLLTSIPIAQPIHFKLTHNEEWIKPLDLKTSTRYLGIWISLLPNSSFIRQQVHNEVAAAAATMKKKYITDKQLKIVFNSVLLPRILYRTQLTFLDHKFCDKIMGTYRKIF